MRKKWKINESLVAIAKVFKINESSMLQFVREKIVYRYRRNIRHVTFFTVEKKLRMFDQNSYFPSRKIYAKVEKNLSHKQI